MDNKTFYANDLNFNNYNKESLKIICQNEIPMQCAYTKLIIELFNNQNFKIWLQDNNITFLDSNRIINSLIKAIKLKTENSENEVILEKISLYDNDLWLKIVDQFLFLDQNIKTNYQNYLSNIIIRRKRSLKKNISKTIEISSL